MNNEKVYYLSENQFIDFVTWKNTECFFFLPSVYYIKYRQNTWASSTCSIIFSWFNYSFQINLTKVNKNISYSLTQEVMETIYKLLKNEQYYISDNTALSKCLSETTNKEYIILCKHIPTHPYLSKLLSYAILLEQKKSGDIEKSEIIKKIQTIPK